jgi:uncharacterized protein YecE (DUF72 family)
LVSIGTAGWSIGRRAAEAFPTVGSALERYSAVFSVAEINSSFRRPHCASTWERWRETVPDGFRFSVKVPKSVTHGAKLVGATDALTTFSNGQHTSRGSLQCCWSSCRPVCRSIQRWRVPSSKTFGSAALPSWLSSHAMQPEFSGEAAILLNELGVARVGADPARVPGAEQPLAARGLAYWRLHGSPIIYRSSYADQINAIAANITSMAAQQHWCIFDNTASSGAIEDALMLKAAMGG